jgi:hypothetical protein
MIGGAFLVFAGVIGLAVSRKKEVEFGTAVPPGDGSKPKTGAADSEVEEALTLDRPAPFSFDPCQPRHPVAGIAY